jgi:transcription elongation factor SPT5
MSNIMNQDFPDNEEDEEDDFNPQPEIASDDELDAKEGGNNDEDDEDDVPKNRSRSDAKREPKSGLAQNDGQDDENEEDEEDEEEEEEEEEEDDDDDDDVEGQPSRKRRKRRRNQFIDVEAEVDEDDEEEPEEEDDLPGEEMHPDDLQELPPGADRDDRMHRELDRQREQQDAMDVEETAARLKERYGRASRGTGTGSAIVPQRLLLPSSSDPRIWRFKCKPGKEREAIGRIQDRFIERQGSREALKIITVFERGATIPGHVYVEAYKLDDIMPAVDGIQHMFLGTKPLMVPVEEMPDLLRTKKSKQLEPGMYVRPKRGLYQGDLALVEDVEPNGTQITLKIVPRLDYGLSEDANAAALYEPDGFGGQKRKRLPKVSTQRPQPRLFSENEARKRHNRLVQRNGGLSNNSFTYNNKTYVDGFLLETFQVKGVLSEDVNPTLEEVTKFASGADDGTENLDLAALSATLKTTSGTDYLPGDKVEIFRGEQKGLSGHAVQVYGDVVRMQVDEGPLTGDIIEAPIRDLRKLFREGDHVKVIGGSKYHDEVGMVVRVKDDRVTILTDSNQQELMVFSKDLREATDSGGMMGFSKFDLYQLVQLDAATVGCVIKVDRETLRVIDQNGSVRTVLQSSISNVLSNNRGAETVATDRDGNEMKKDDTVKEWSGEQRGGRAIHLHRGFAFVQNRESRENSGIFVTRSNNLITVAGKGGRIGNGPDLTKMNPLLKQGGGGPGAAMPPPQRGRDKLIGRTVKIRAGPQKGMIGIVKDSTALGAIIELHGKIKKITLPKEKLAVIDPQTGAVVHADAQTFGTGRPPPQMQRGPAPGGQTPSRGFGSTPMQSGGRTPAYAMQGGRTPAWKQDTGSRTPAYASGGQTAYGNGGQTSYGGATSYGGGGGSSVWGGSGAVSHEYHYVDIWFNIANLQYSNQHGTPTAAAAEPRPTSLARKHQRMQAVLRLLPLGSARLRQELVNIRLLQPMLHPVASPKPQQPIPRHLLQMTARDMSRLREAEAGNLGFERSHRRLGRLYTMSRSHPLVQFDKFGSVFQTLHDCSLPYLLRTHRHRHHGHSHICSTRLSRQSWATSSSSSLSRTAALSSFISPSTSARKASRSCWIVFVGRKCLLRCTGMMPGAAARAFGALTKLR